MEAQSCGGEIRRVHVVYFLSREGRIEHPHLIRVHHLSRYGVRLRDVKRWLSELRGKDMPESFAWSYKRKYKTGYVWQDLLDEDLITPISDNEYVLKGSEISSNTFTNDLGSFDEKQVAKSKKAPTFEHDVKDLKTPLTQEEAQESPVDLSTKTSFEIEELPSFGSETSTEDTIKHQEDFKNHVTTKQEEEEEEEKEEVESRKNKSGTNSLNENKKKDTRYEVSASPKSSFGKSSSYSGFGASNMFRNWITCGIVDTNDSAVTVINRRERNGSNSLMSLLSKKENGKGENMGQLCKEEKLGGSMRFSGCSWTPLEQQNRRKSCDGKNGSKENQNGDSNNLKTFPAAYKPVNGPNCSQCGRQFKPEKLHTHMKSCRGMKDLAKPTSKTADNKPKRTTIDASSQNYISPIYLTNR